VIPLVYHPDDRLTTVASEVLTIDGELARFAEGMVETMHAARGIGLAGPQVGRLERFFVVHTPEDDPRVFINPRIVAVSPEEGPYEEGCLSIPGVYAEVRRPLEITVEAFDTDGSPFRLDAGGILARVILHEYDHLEGVLFIDRMTSRRRDRIMKHYRKPTDGDDGAAADDTAATADDAAATGDEAGGADVLSREGAPSSDPPAAGGADVLSRDGAPSSDPPAAGGADNFSRDGAPSSDPPTAGGEA
jgi:peptide deformylase